MGKMRECLPACGEDPSTSLPSRSLLIHSQELKGQALSHVQYQEDDGFPERRLQILTKGN